MTMVDVMFKPGTPAQYAKAMKMLIAYGESPDLLNRANHTALATGAITLAHFQAAAQELARLILAR